MGAVLGNHQYLYFFFWLRWGIKNLLVFEGVRFQNKKNHSNLIFLTIYQILQNDNIDLIHKAFFGQYN